MNKTKDKLLGMSFSTASYRLTKDIIFDFIVKTGQNRCYRCGHPMSRDTFSIEHKEIWSIQDNPLESFFDLENISFSHLKCNTEVRTRPVKPCGTHASYRRGCRCDNCVTAEKQYQKDIYSSRKRRERYLKTKG